jgi:hypothetical protein
MRPRTDAIEDVVNLLIRRLRKVVVPETNGAEWFGRLGTDDVIGNLPKRVARFRCRNWNSDHDPSSAFLSECLDAGPHGGACRQTVIDQDDRLVPDIGEGTVASVLSFAPLQFRLFCDSHSLNVRIAHAGDADEIAVEHANTAGGNRANGKLFLPRQSELSYDEHVKRDPERRSDLKADRYAATRQRQNDDVGAVCIGAELVGKSAARVASIAKWSAHKSSQVYTQTGVAWHMPSQRSGFGRCASVRVAGNATTPPRTRVSSAESCGYFRSNVSTSGLSLPAMRTVIVKVFKSAESANSSVDDTFPSCLLVITNVRASTRRSAEEAPGLAFGT